MTSQPEIYAKDKLREAFAAHEGSSGNRFIGEARLVRRGHALRQHRPDLQLPQTPEGLGPSRPSLPGRASLNFTIPFSRHSPLRSGAELGLRAVRRRRAPKRPRVPCLLGFGSLPQ